MSSFVLPNLPGLSIELAKAPSYNTKILSSVSGKEIRVSWRSTATTRYLLKYNFLRTATAAPNETALSPAGNDWSAYNEASIIRYFHSYHKGSFEPFQIRDPEGGALVTAVHFTSDVLSMTQIVTGLWKCDIEVETVL
jgi:hypothetical protein